MSQSAYLNLIRGGVSSLEAAIAKLERTGNVDAFAARFADILEEVHLGAVYQGRTLAGVTGRIGDDDRTLARELVDRQAEFAEGFLDDLDSGRYTSADGKVSVPAIRNRAFMYLESVRGSANEAFVVFSEPDDTFEWELGLAEHCADCLELARLSPFEIDELYTKPGQCDTDCRSRCRCKLRRVRDQVSGFDYVDPYDISRGGSGVVSAPSRSKPRVAASA
jgi:hypothetical protein